MMALPWSHQQPYRWIVWSTIVITAVGLTAAGWSLSTIERRLVAAAGQSLAQASENGARSLDQLLDERHGDLAVLAQTRLLRTREYEAISSHLHRMRSAYSGYSNFLVADAQGRVVAGTDPEGVGADVSRTPWFTGAMSRREVFVTEVHDRGLQGEKQAVSLSVSLRGDDGVSLGVVVGWVRLTVLDELLSNTVSLLRSQWGAGGQVEYMLFSEGGDVLADSILHQDPVNLLALGVPSALAVGLSPAGYVEETHGRRNIQVISGYAQTQGGVHAPNLKWGVLMRVDRDHVRAPITTLLWKLGVGWIVIAGPMIVMLLWSAKRLERFGAQQSVRATTSEEALHLHIASLRSVVEAARVMTETRDLDQLFHTLLGIARRDTEAASAVVTLFDSTSGGVSRVITQGVTEDMLEEVEQSPIGKGLMDRLTQDPKPIRLTNLAHHLVAMGFTTKPLLVSAFLGAPIRAHGRLFGALCLLDKRMADGRLAEFTDLDEQVVIALTAQAGVAIENLLALTQARRQATYDSLTGILNHSAILEALETELSRAQRTGDPVSVLLLDLDHFKAVNDTYGHGAGDQVLVETANRIRAILRPYDVTGRVGGEEFLVVLPKCGPAAAAQLADRLRRSIGEEPFNRSSGQFRVTASIGLTSWPGSLPTSPTVLLEVADEALYRAKRAGRNRIEVGTPRIAPLSEQQAG